MCLASLKNTDVSFNYWGVVCYVNGVPHIDFIIKAATARKLQNLSIPHSYRLMSLRVPIIQDNKFSTVLSVYAPTVQAENRVKEGFSDDLYNLLQQVDPKDKLLILGNFKTTMGRHRIGNCNVNGRLLLEFCSEHQLVTTNTLFKQKVGSRQHGSTRVPNTGISWTTP